MEKIRFDLIDRWLTRTLRYVLHGLFASVDELHRLATDWLQLFGKRDLFWRTGTDQPIGKQELLWVATNATKRLRRGQLIYRFVVERTETGIFVGLNEESEAAHWQKVGPLWYEGPAPVLAMGGWHCWQKFPPQEWEQWVDSLPEEGSNGWSRLEWQEWHNRLVDRQWEWGNQLI